jgi:hypothetical protein
LFPRNLLPTLSLFVTRPPSLPWTCEFLLTKDFVCLKVV